jgi:hypothetical protein
VAGCTRDITSACVFFFSGLEFVYEEELFLFGREG